MIVSSSKRVRFSLVFPFHNEEKRLPRQLSAYARYIQSHGIEAEIICVDDASTDQSFRSVTELIESEKFAFVQVFKLPSPGFKYGAVQAAFRLANAPLVGFVDTDDSLGPETTFKLFTQLEDRVDDLDVVLGSRFTLGQSSLLNAGTTPFSTPDDHTHSLLTFRFTNMVSRLLYGLPFADVEIGLKVLKKSFAEVWDSQIKCQGNIFFDAEMLWILKKHGARIAEFPIAWQFRDNIFEDQGVGRSLLKTGRWWLHIAYYLGQTRLKHVFGKS
ncbi:MAG: glycosyltransferase [Candidatus Margulisiibacteriota bacterium]